MRYDPEREIWLTSYSELSTLAQCEQKWHYRYFLGDKDPGTVKMHLGRLIHAGARAFWSTPEGGHFAMRVSEAMRAEYEAIVKRPMTNEDLLKEPWITAIWLMERYIPHYRPSFTKVKVEHEEVKLMALLEGLIYKDHPVWLTGYLDHIFRLNSGLWLVERKTMGDWQRLDLIDVDLQLTLYYWLAQQNGFDIEGILFDAIRTYRWKRDERPPSESFQQIWVDRTPEQVDAAMAWVQDVILRTNHLQAGWNRPIRNIGPLCKGCHFQSSCFEGLSFPTEIEMLEEDEAA